MQESPRGFAQRLIQRMSMSDVSDKSDIFDERFNLTYQQYKFMLVVNNFSALLNEFGTLTLANLLPNTPQGTVEKF